MDTYHSIYHCKNYLVKMNHKSIVTVISGFIRQVGSMIKGFQNMFVIHQPPHLVSEFICTHLLVIIRF